MLANLFVPLATVLLGVIANILMFHIAMQPVGIAPQEFAAEKFPTLGAVQERWQTVEAGVREYLARLTEQGLVVPLTYVNVRGETWTYPLWQTLFHVVNHQTYHRGQVTTILRQLGLHCAPSAPPEKL